MAKFPGKLIQEHDRTKRQGIFIFRLKKWVAHRVAHRVAHGPGFVYTRLMS